MGDFLRVLRFELLRMAHRPVRLAVSMACLCLCLPLSYATMESAAMLAQSDAAGATALDVFYASINTREVVGMLLPLAIGVHIVDILGGDLETGMACAVLPRLKAPVWAWPAKAFSCLIVSTLCVLLLWTLCFSFDAVACGMPIGDGSPSTWLSYEGDYATAFEADPARFQIMQPLPESWSMLAFELYAAMAYSVFYSGAFLLIAALCAGSRNRRAPLIASSVAVLTVWGIHGMVYMWNSEWLARIMSLAGVDAPSLYAQPLYWLMPIGYRLGAGFFSQGVEVVLDGVGERMFGHVAASTALIPMALLLMAGILGAWKTRDGWRRLL